MLVPFCEFYVYSYGIKSYVLKALSIIDPNGIYFKKRDIRVIAPESDKMQAEWALNKKSIYHFK
jgi:hypothetical protein